MVLTQDLLEATDELGHGDIVPSDFVPRTLAHLGRASFRSCQLFAKLEPDVSKVASSWNDVATTLAQLAKAVFLKYPDSEAVREIAQLQREAEEVSTFYNCIPSLE